MPSIDWEMFIMPDGMSFEDIRVIGNRIITSNYAPIKTYTVLEKVQQLWTRSNYYNSLPKKFSKTDIIKGRKHHNLYYKDPRAKW